MHARVLWLLLVVIPVAIAGQQNIGRSRQAVVGGEPIAPMLREEYGWLSIATPGGSCSASLLTNGRAIFVPTRGPIPLFVVAHTFYAGPEPTDLLHLQFDHPCIAGRVLGNELRSHD